MTPTNASLSTKNKTDRPDIWRAGWFNAMTRFLVLTIIFLVFVFLVEDFAFIKARNLENILRQSAVYMTAALGATMIIITAGIDLSVGSIIAMSVVVVAWTLNLQGGDGQQLIHQFPIMLPIAAVMLGVLAATMAGCFNGATTVGLKLPPFIVTLGSMGMIRGAAKMIASERDIYPPQYKLPSGETVSVWVEKIMDPTLVPFMNWLSGKGEAPTGLGWLILPLGVWILIISAVFAALLLRYTRFGRHVFAVGSNEETARLCGVPVGRTKIMVYALAGLFAGLAGLMQFSFIGGIGQPTTAISYELFVIAAVVVGGASLMGGEGSILGSIVGALIITVLNMGGQQAGWSKPTQEILIGAIIVTAAALDQWRHRKMA